MTDDYPPTDDARDRTTDREGDRAEPVGRLLDGLRIEDRSYPVRGEEIEAVDADGPVADAVGRLEGKYGSPAAVREALRDELTDGEADEADDVD